MKHGRIQLIQEFFVTQINSFLAYPIIAMLVFLFDSITPAKKPDILLWGLLGLFALALYAARVRIESFPLFLAIHLGGILLALIMPAEIFPCLYNTVNRFFLVLQTSCFAVYSLFLRAKERVQDSAPSAPVAVGIYACSLFMQHYQKNTKWDMYYIFLLIFIMALYFLQFYTSKYLSFLTVNAGSTGILPEKEIFHAGFRQIFLYTLSGCFVLAACSRLTWLNTLLAAVTEFIRNILSAVFHLFPNQSSVDTIPEHQEISTGANPDFPVSGSPGMFWKILEVIAFIAVAILLVLLVLFALRRFLRFFKMLSHKRTVRQAETVLTEIGDMREKCMNVEPGHIIKQHSPFALLAPRERIRRIYKKKAVQYASEQAPYMTAGELQKSMHTGSFAEIYERTRYSDAPCTGTDVKEMKRLIERK